MASWREKVNETKRPTATRVSRNGQVVLPASARRAAGIEAGDLVVSVPIAPGAVLVEKVEVTGGSSLKELYEATDELRGLWGDDPDGWIDAFRGPWIEPPDS
jgi:AbrB family looped-hinge helix DNA binding protein